MSNRPVTTESQRGILERGGDWVERKPIWILLFAAFLCAVAWFGVSRVSFSGTDGLFDPDDPAEVRYRQWSDDFNAAGEVVVLFDTGEQREFEDQAKLAAHALGQSLKDETRIAEVVWGFSRHDVSPKLLLTQPLARVESELDSMAELEPLLTSETPTQLLQAAASRSIAPGESDGSGYETKDLRQAADLFNALMGYFTERLTTPADEPIDMFAQMESALGDEPWQWLRSANGRLLVMRVVLREGVDQTPGYGESLKILRNHLDAVRSRFDGVEMGLTGFEPVRGEAQAAIRAASIRAVGGAALGLVVLCGLAWRNAVLPLVVAATTATSMWLAVGLCGLILGAIGLMHVLGLAVTAVMTLYGVVMLCAAYARSGSAREAQVATFPVFFKLALVVVLVATVVGIANPIPGIRGAAVTLVIGSFCAAVSVLLFCTAGLAVLAGMNRNQESRVDPRVADREDAAGLLADWATRSPKNAWVLAALFCAMLLALAWPARTTFDLTGFLPAETEGARWQKRAAEDGGEMGLAAAYVVDDLEQAIVLTQRLRQLPEVSRVSGISRLVPENLPAKRERLNQLESKIGDAARNVAEAVPSVAEPDGSSSGQALVSQIQAAAAAMGFFEQRLTGEELKPLLADMQKQANAFIEAQGQVDPDIRRARFEVLQAEYTACRKRVGEMMRDLLEDRPIELADIRQAYPVFSGWIAGALSDDPGKPMDQNEINSPRLMVKIYPTSVTDQPWPAPNELDDFFTALQTVNPEVTGDLERITQRSSDMISATKQALLIAAVIFGIGVLIFSRQFINALCGAGLLGLLSAGFAAITFALGQSVTAVAWVLWPAAGVLLVGWIFTLSAAAPQSIGDVKTSRTMPKIRRAAGAEAFGLTLAAGFILAAGLRSAGAPALTATAVGWCVATGVVGLIAVLVVRPKAQPTESHKQASA